MKFNVGDKVRVIRNAYQYQYNETGTIVAIALGKKNYPYDIKFDNHVAQAKNHFHWGDFELELVQPKVEPPKEKFVQTLGFNTELLVAGTPIHINDTELVSGGRIVGWDIPIDEYDYRKENKTGTYIVKHSFPTLLILTDIYGKEVKLPIRHFIQGARPRMSYEVYTK